MARDERLQAVLEELALESGVLGAALVSRDGASVRASGRLVLARETLSAMSATALAATELALGELDGGRPQHLVATSDRLKLVIVAAGRDLLLVVVTQADMAHERLLARLDGAAQSVALAER